MEILSSLPGAGRLATLLAEASPAPQRRPALPVRSRAVTTRSGKSVFVLRRLVTRKRLQDAMHRRTAVQHDAKAKYAALRARGHAGAFRSVADRLLACAMLENQTGFRADHESRTQPAV